MREMSTILDSIFTESQQQEIKMATEHCKESVPILCQHPEWSSSLMNFVFNRIGENKDYSEVVAFAEAAPVITEGTERDKIGDLDMLCTYSLIETFGDKAGKNAIEYIREHQDVSANKLLYDMIQLQFKDYPDRRIRLSRLDSNIINRTDALLAIMSEGNDDVKALLERVYFKSSAVNKNSGSSENSMINRLGRGYMNILALDDMNIRGEQVKYAYEYCGNDFKTFVDIICNRDKQMIQYVNQKSIENARKQGSIYVPQAVEHGASFSYFTSDKIFSFDFDTYNDSINALNVKWADREIYSGTPTDEAIKILEANGFEMVYDQNVKKYGCYTDNVRHIIMHNPETGAIMDAPSAATDDICYGGCDITVLVKDSHLFGISMGIAMNCIQDYPGVQVCDMSYQDGLMCKYKKALSSGDPVPDSRIMNKSMHKIPLLSSSDDYSFAIDCHHNYNKHVELQGYLNFGVGYKFTIFMDCLKMPESLKRVEDTKKWLFQTFVENPYQETISRGYFTNDIHQNSLLLGAAFKMCGVSESEIDKYYEAAVAACDQLYNKESALEYLKSKEGKDIFYGKSKLTCHFLDEFQLK